MKSMMSFLCEKEFEKNDWFCEVQFSIIKQGRTTSGMYILVYIVYASCNRFECFKVL